jgi:hypothetical protein
MLSELSNEKYSGPESDSGPPKPTKKDAAYSLAKVGLSAIPVFGGTAAEIFSAVIAPPITKRTAAWVESISERLKDLEKTVSGFKLENLAENQAFTTVVLHATQIAIRSHQQRKIEALRNAVINTALGTNISEDEEHIFLEYVDALTPSHLKLLEFLDNPAVYGKAHNVKYGNYSQASVSTILEEAFPEWKGKRVDYDLIAQDLYTRGLLGGQVNDLHVGGSATDQGMYARRTTDRGKRFLQFIRAQP